MESNGRCADMLSGILIMKEQTDMQAIASGDIRAFEQIFLQYQPKLIYFLKGFLQDEEMSRDMAQDIFLSLWENRARLAEVKSFSAYLFRIARYNVYNHFDRLLVQEKYTVEQILQINEPESIEDNLFLKELQAFIDHTVDLMPPQRQRIFRMSRQEGLSNDDIARQLDISKRTVENHLTAALADLRKVLFLFCFFI